MAVSWKTVTTYPIADSQNLTAMDPVKLSSGKVTQDTTDLSQDIIGFSTQTKSMGVLATVGQQEYTGVVSEGLIELTGMVEGSGGTYTTAISIGDVVSMYWDGTTPYAVNSASGPVGRVVAIGSAGSVQLAASGTTTDSTETITVEVDLAINVAEIGAGSVGTAELANGAVKGTKISAGGVDSLQLAAAACTGTKLGADVVTSIAGGATIVDVGGYVIGSTSTTVVVDFTATLSGTAKVFCQALTATGSIPIPSSITDTNFTVTGTNSQTGDWFAVIV